MKAAHPPLALGLLLFVTLFVVGDSLVAAAAAGEAAQQPSTYARELAYRNALVDYYLWAYRRLAEYLRLYGGNAASPTKETVPVAPPVAEPDCKAVGEACVYQSDCCSNACPSFLGKCVTK